jgi:hypothetical protein
VYHRETTPLHWERSRAHRELERAERALRRAARAYQRAQVRFKAAQLALLEAHTSPPLMHDDNSASTQPPQEDPCPESSSA